uniref:AB hydrolase-1 domain-containing protein n=1 Tax=Xiphophorus couchianus TaxID=32473 RepID=A0A3B5MG27_9TELE
MELRWAKKLLLTGGVLLVPVFALVTSVVFWPGVLLKAYSWYMCLSQGVAVRYSHSASYRFCYSTRGTPGCATPTLLLLHGFSTSKEMWLSVIKYLPRNLHVVCLDMPGHEGTSRTGAEDYSIQGQARRVHQVRANFLRGLLANRIPNNNFYREVFLAIIGEKSRHSLQQHLNLITAPLQVIWGKNDQILDVSGAAVIQKVLPHCQVDLLDNCGHAIALERPRKFANLVLDFHNKAKKQA